MTTAARRTRYFQAARRRKAHPWDAWTTAADAVEREEKKVTSEQPTFEPLWAVVELMGHQRRAGRISQETIVGPMLRIDVPGPDERMITQYYAASAIYSISPVSEELARAVARHNQPAPVSRYELPPSVSVESRRNGYEEEGLDGG